MSSSLISLRITIKDSYPQSHPRTFAVRWGGAGGGSGGQPRQGALSALRGQDRPGGGGRALSSLHGQDRPAGGGRVQTKLPLFFLTKRIIFSRFLNRSEKVKKYCMTLHPVLSILQIYLRKWDKLFFSFLQISYLYFCENKYLMPFGKKAKKFNFPFNSRRRALSSYSQLWTSRR